MINTFSTKCSHCGEGVSHSRARCDANQFQTNKATKYGLVSVISMGWAHSLLTDVLAQQLEKAYPRVVSKIFREDIGSRPVIDIFVETWAMSAMQSFYATEGYAGMTLSEFLVKVADERTTK